MTDFFTIIRLERRTLVRGFLVSFIVILPFTFLPIITDGLTWGNISKRFPISAFYSFGMALFLVVVAVIHNYQNLVSRKRYFDKPAFAKLDFYGRLDGVDSIVNELETFLLGKVKHYYFRINLIEPDRKDISVEIVPLIDLTADKDLKKRLKKELGFRENRFFGTIIKATEKDLLNENYLSEKLIDLDANLNEWGVKPLKVDENSLWQK